MIAPSKPIHEMSEEAWRVHVDYQLETIKNFQKWQLRIWWGVASTVAFVVGNRFLEWIFNNNVLASVAGS